MLQILILSSRVALTYISVSANFLALDEQVLKRVIYVDDVQTGHATIDEALKIRNYDIAAL